MTMASLIICILFQKIILAIVKKIGNVNSLRLGATMLLIATIVLTFGKSFMAMLLYKSIHELAVMFLNMDEIILKSNLKFVNRKDDYFKIRNKSKIIYAIITLFTALVAGKMFNVNHYLPMYLSIIINVLVLGTAFLYYEAKVNKEQEMKKEHKKLKITSIIFYVIISNKDEQQKIVIDIEIYRRVGTLILSAIFTLILMKYDMVVVEFILLGLSIGKIFINKKLCDKLNNLK